MTKPLLSSVPVLVLLAFILGCQRHETTKPTAEGKDPNQSEAEASNPVILRLDEAVRRDPNSPEFYWNRASAWFDRGKFDRAAHDLSEAIRLDPTNSAYFDSRGFAYHMENRQEEKALADYAEAIRLDPRNHHALNNRAYLLATTKYSDALKTALIDTGYAGEIIGGTRQFDSLLPVFPCVAARNRSPWS